MPVSRLKHSLLLATWLGACCALFGTAAAQEDEESPYRPGLIATYTAGGTSAVRTDEVVAFDWQDAACDPRLPAGEFTATGWPAVGQGRGQLSLACYVQGEVEVKLAGKTVIAGRAEQPQWLSSQPLELEFDHHPLEITFRKNGSSRPARPVLVRPRFSTGADPRAGACCTMREQVRSIAFERGRQLAAALRCAACHQDAAASVPPAPALDRLIGQHSRSLAGRVAQLACGRRSERWQAATAADAGFGDDAAGGGGHRGLAAARVRRQSRNRRQNEQKETKVTKEEEKRKKAEGKGRRRARRSRSRRRRKASGSF